MVHRTLKFLHHSHTSFSTPIIRLDNHSRSMWQPLKSSQNNSVITWYTLVVHFLSLGSYPIRSPCYSQSQSHQSCCFCFAFSNTTVQHYGLHTTLPNRLWNSVATDSDAKLFHQDLPRIEAIKSYIAFLQTRNLHSSLYKQMECTPWLWK